ncbi:hypothetical protein AC1031_012223 [Aphanomyces cochlioides]|nr:hypothetical protein AC1031_012223 [Aphanomyces cochlioides]
MTTAAPPTSRFSFVDKSSRSFIYELSHQDEEDAINIDQVSALFSSVDSTGAESPRVVSRKRPRPAMKDLAASLHVDQVSALFSKLEEEESEAKV